MLVIPHENNNDMSISIDFAKEIGSGHILNRSDINFNRVIQVVVTPTNFRKFSLNSSELAQKQAMLQAAENGCFLAINIAS